jgi:hypothetical protein
MEDHRATSQQHYAHAAVSDFHGALIDACVQADTATAPQTEHSHSHSCGAGARVLRLQEIALHHASPGLLGFAWWAEASSSVIVNATTNRKHCNSLFIPIQEFFCCLRQREVLALRTNLLSPPGLKAGIPRRIVDG